VELKDIHKSPVISMLNTSKHNSSSYLNQSQLNPQDLLQQHQINLRILKITMDFLNNNLCQFLSLSEGYRSNEEQLREMKVCSVDDKVKKSNMFLLMISVCVFDKQICYLKLNYYLLSFYHHNTRTHITTKTLNYLQILLFFLSSNSFPSSLAISLEILFFSLHIL